MEDLPLPAKLKDLEEAFVMKQTTFDEHGRIIEKDRLTHDQCYKRGFETSVNRRVDKDLLLPFKFGASLKRLMNWAVAARKKYLNAEAAVQTCTPFPEGNFAIMALRLTFCGCACPYE